MTDFLFALRACAASIHPTERFDHVLRVCGYCSTDDERTLVVLDHTPAIGVEQLRRAGFSFEIQVGLAHLRNAGKNRTSKAALQLIAKNPLATQVALADLRDHADLVNLGREPRPADIKANQELVAAMDFLERAAAIQKITL